MIDGTNWIFYLDGIKTNFFSDMNFSMPAITYDTITFADSEAHGGFGFFADLNIYSVALNNFEVSCLADLCESKILCKEIQASGGFPTCNL